jgi:hypothetical protein
MSLIAAWNDTTVFFHGGGTLSGWLVTDDAWQEYEKWFPYCVYLRHIKGDSFFVIVQEYFQEKKEIESTCTCVPCSEKKRGVKFSDLTIIYSFNTIPNCMHDNIKASPTVSGIPPGQNC